MGASRTPSIITVLLVVCICALPAAGQLPTAGSVLIFPVHRSGGGMVTIVSVTNTATGPAGPATFGATTFVHYQYVNTVPNPVNPLRPLSCNVIDRFELLTPADTLSVLTGCHTAVIAGGQNGYLVVSAHDPSTGALWSHNHLVGSALVINASGGMYSVNAISFRSLAAAGAPADVAPANGKLDFNGMEYDAIPDLLFIDSFIALAGSQLSLLSLTGNSQDLQTVNLSVWNDNEIALSTTLVFNCWFDVPLSQISTLFTQAFLLGTMHDPGELDVNCDGVGDLETGWARIDSVGVATVGGNFVSADGALLGCITAGPTAIIDGGHLLWGSTTLQTNGRF